MTGFIQPYSLLLSNHYAFAACDSKWVTVALSAAGLLFKLWWLWVGDPSLSLDPSYIYSPTPLTSSIPPLPPAPHLLSLVCSVARVWAIFHSGHVEKSSCGIVPHSRWLRFGDYDLLFQKGEGMVANEARTKYEVKLKAIFKNLILAAIVGFEVRFVVFANSLPLILRR